MCAFGANTEADTIPCLLGVKNYLNNCLPYSRMRAGPVSPA